MSISHILFCCMVPCRSDQVRVCVSCILLDMDEGVSIVVLTPVRAPLILCVIRND